MKILGIDPGLKATGYGLIDYSKRETRLIETGTLNPKPKELMQQKLLTVHTLLDQILVEHNPDVLILEKLYAHRFHPMTASIMGHVRGVICLLCAQRNVELVEQSVKRIRKALTGNGNASKIQTKKFVAYQLGIDAEKLTLDASDACALVLGYIHLLGHRL